MNLIVAMLWAGFTNQIRRRAHPLLWKSVPVCSGTVRRSQNQLQVLAFERFSLIRMIGSMPWIFPWCAVSEKGRPAHTAALLHRACAHLTSGLERMRWGLHRWDKSSKRPWACPRVSFKDLCSFNTFPNLGPRVCHSLSHWVGSKSEYFDRIRPSFQALYLPILYGDHWSDSGSNPLFWWVRSSCCLYQRLFLNRSCAPSSLLNLKRVMD